MSTTVYVFLNEQVDSDGRHVAWEHGYETWHKMVPAMSWVEDPLQDAADTDLLNFSFAELGNCPEFGSVGERWQALQHRSLSIGDGVKIVRDGQFKYYVVERRGFTEVIPWDSRSLPETVGEVTDRYSRNRDPSLVESRSPSRRGYADTRTLALTRVRAGHYTYSNFIIRGILRRNPYDQYDFEYWAVKNPSGHVLAITPNLRDARRWLASNT